MKSQTPFFYYYPQQANPRPQAYYSGSPFSHLPSVWSNGSYQPAGFPSTYTFLQSTSVVGSPMQYSEVLLKTKGCNAEEGEESPIVEKITRDFFAEEELTDFQKKLNKFIGSGVGKFVDIDFPPNFKSLVGENAEKKKDWVHYCWLRPEEFMDYTKPILPIVGKIEPNDIRQGKLNDGTLLSSLASIAEHPHRIKKLLNFEFPEKSEEEVIALCKKHGIYCVRFFDMGVPIEVVIDDIFPCAPLENFTTAFTRTLENEMWSLLIEKAWAKCYGSYADIDSLGFARHSLYDFTGAPTKTVWCDEDHLWPNILKGEAKNWIMTTGANAAVEKEDVTAEGIVTDQSYSLLAGIEFEDQESGGLVKLVKLRDPHGTKEWKGKWSDDSKEFERIPTKHTEEGRNKKDGIFFMDFEDFKKNFVNVQFCMVNDDFKYSYAVSKVSKKKGACFRVKIIKKGQYFFTVLQKNRKKYPKQIQDDNFEFSFATMVVAKKQGEDYQYIFGNFQKLYETTKSKENEELDTGEYLVWVKYQWKYADEDKFTLSVYGSDSVEISQINQEKDFLEKVYLNYSNQCKNVKKVEGIEGCEIRDEITESGYAFVAIRNGNKEKKVNCEIKFINLKENLLKLKRKPHEEVKKFSLDPNGEKILLLRMEGYGAKEEFYNAHIVAEN